MKVEAATEGVLADDNPFDSDSSDCDVTFFEWDIKRLNQLFDDPENGRAFKNAIFSLWLKSVTDYIYNLEDKIKNERM